jgi:hypothetical protein
MKNKLQQLIPWMHPYKIGFYPPMLFNKPRNTFYWKLLKQCKDKVCVDVGFGTGILTLMALHHGAKHVYAYEEDPTTFLLGQYIVEKLGFSDKVTFVNEKYKSQNHRHLDIDLIFHEIFGRNIWREDCRDTFKGVTTKVVPSVMSCNIRLFEGKIETDRKPDLRVSSTGLKWLDETYVEVLKDLWNEIDTITYDGIPYHAGKIIGSWEIDINSWIPKVIKVDVDADIGIVFTDYFIDGFLLTSADSWPCDKSIRINKKFKRFCQNTKDGNWWLE